MGSERTDALLEGPARVVPSRSPAVSHKPRIPRLVPGVDVRALPLSPTDGFVLSRVDGVASVGDIADLTNQSADECMAVLERLLALRAIEWADGAVSLPRASMRPAATGSAPSRPAGDPPSRPSVLPKGTAVEEQRVTPTPGADRRSEPPPTHAGARNAILERQQSLPSPPITVGSTPAAPATPPPPEDDNELPLDRRKKIDDLWFALDLLNHYELLGVSRKAARPEIRNAYNELAKTFHPDTAFRKKIGKYRTKMEAIFKRLTEAYEVLGKPKAREEYDAYLSSIGESKEAEEALSGEHELPPELTATTPGSTTAPTAAGITAPGITAVGTTAAGITTPGTVSASAPSATTPSSKTAPSKTAPPKLDVSGELPLPPPVTNPPPAGIPTARKSTSGTMPAVREEPPAPRVVSEESRRRAAELFQRRLDGAQGRTLRSSTPPPMPAVAPRTRDEMARELRSAIHSSNGVSGGVAPTSAAALVAHQLADARRAEAQGELAMAVRSLRLALATAPERADIAEEHERVSKLLAVSLADRYSDQAVYEERHKKWAAAAISWAKVLEGRPDDRTALLGAAHSLVEAQGDMRKAQRFAQRAVDLHPQDPVALTLLGRVCLMAGLPLNARRALQQAIALDPAAAQAKSLLAMVTTQGG